METNVIFTVIDRIAIITLNRPERLNALNYDLLHELDSAIEQVDQDPNIFGAIITGQGKAFCAGGDLKERLSRFTPDSSMYGDAFLSQLRKIFDRIENIGKPVLAAINGSAFGGGMELALACDIRIISQTAKVGLTEPRVGMIPGAGGTQRLPRLIGISRAKELLFNAAPIDSEEAYRIGLVNDIVPDGEDVVEAALHKMCRYEQNAPLAIRMAKFAVNKGTQMSLAEGLDLEASCTTFLRTTQDRVEGITAFQEKRKPKFTGQ